MCSCRQTNLSEHGLYYTETSFDDCRDTSTALRWMHQSCTTGSPSSHEDLHLRHNLSASASQTGIAGTRWEQSTMLSLLQCRQGGTNPPACTDTLVHRKAHACCLQASYRLTQLAGSAGSHDRAVKFKWNFRRSYWEL